MLMKVFFFRAILGALLLVFPSGTMAASLYDEYQLKAEITYGIAKFVTWPEDTFLLASEPFIVCVLGEGSAVRGFDSLEGRVINGHRVLLKYVESWEEYQRGHLIYVSGNYADQLDQILHHLGDRPVLSASDMNDFAAQGGMINLVSENEAVRFVINLSSVHKAGLTVSSKLNTLAAHVIRKAD